MWLCDDGCRTMWLYDDGCRTMWLYDDGCRTMWLYDKCSYLHQLDDLHFTFDHYKDMLTGNGTVTLQAPNNTLF